MFQGCIIKKGIILFLIEVLLIAIVIILGFKSAKDSNYILWFGLASALIDHLGISAISSIFNVGNNEKIKKLLKIAQIDFVVRNNQDIEQVLDIGDKAIINLFGVDPDWRTQCREIWKKL